MCIIQRGAKTHATNVTLYVACGATYGVYHTGKKAQKNAIHLLPCDLLRRLAGTRAGWFRYTHSEGTVSFGI